jgi:hypothetical protein
MLDTCALCEARPPTPPSLILCASCSDNQHAELPEEIAETVTFTDEQNVTRSRRTGRVIFWSDRAKRLLGVLTLVLAGLTAGGCEDDCQVVEDTGDRQLLCCPVDDETGWWIWINKNSTYEAVGPACPTEE